MKEKHTDTENDLSPEQIEALLERYSILRGSKEKQDITEKKALQHTLLKHTHVQEITQATAQEEMLKKLVHSEAPLPFNTHTEKEQIAELSNFRLGDEDKNKRCFTLMLNDRITCQVYVWLVTQPADEKGFIEDKDLPYNIDVYKNTKPQEIEPNSPPNCATFCSISTHGILGGVGNELISRVAHMLQEQYGKTLTLVTLSPTSFQATKKTTEKDLAFYLVTNKDGVFEFHERNGAVFANAIVLNGTCMANYRYFLGTLGELSQSYKDGNMNISERIQELITKPIELLSSKAVVTRNTLELYQRSLELAS